MADKVMTDNEIIKALEELRKEQEDGYITALEHDGKRDPKHEEFLDLLAATLDLINRQKAEIERLNKALANVSAKALKAFERNIKDAQFTLGQTWEIQCALKKTLKEMVGDNNG